MADVIAQTPEVWAGVDEEYPKCKKPDCGKMYCPNCGSSQTGYYEMHIRRFSLHFRNGDAAGEPIDSVMNDDLLVTDKKGDMLCDCVTCGHRWTV